MKPIRLLALGVVSASLLAGCEITTFEKAPLVAAACDPALVGHWSSIGGTDQQDGDLQFDIAPNCTLELFDRYEGKMRGGAATRLNVGVHENIRYAWLDADWSLARFDSDLKASASDVLVLRYAVHGDELSVNAPDDKAIAHRMLDGEVPGSTAKDSKGLQNRITGGPHPTLLANAWFFDQELLRFRRATVPAD